VLDANAARKLEHFMMLCDAYHIPLVFLVDTPGFMVGTETERQGLISGAARLLQLHNDLSVPKITVVLRKAYGLAYSILGGTPVSPDSIAAWPIASFSVMDPAPAANVLFRREIEAADDPKAKRAELIDTLQSDSNPFGAVRDFRIDEVLDPADTRRFICTRLRAVAHGTLPPGFRRRVLRI
jgi:acetyl-CoA carboxylase carboxyltransferase component